MYHSSPYGNVYNNRCIYVHSGPVHAIQLHEAFTETLGHSDGIVVNTVSDNKGEYQRRSYVWLDDPEDYRKLLSQELTLKSIHLESDQVKKCGIEDFELRISPTFITPGTKPDEREDQLFVNNVPADDPDFIHAIFDRYAISNKNNVKVNIFKKQETKNTPEYYALITFTDPNDCAFALVMTRKFRALYKGKPISMSVRNAIQTENKIKPSGTWKKRS